MRKLIMVMAALLAGCAAQNPWTKPGATQAMLTADVAQCQYETDRATASIENAVHAGVQDTLLN